MAETWRLIDTGLRPATQNIALDRALLEARRAEESPSTLRFLRFPRCALIGSDRSAVHELDLDHCRAAGLRVQRRITGGEAMCLDEGQLVWALCLHRRELGGTDLRVAARRLCHAAAAAVSALGLDARFRAPGEIEVDGRRVAESGGVLDGDAVLFQGALFVDADPAALLQASRLPPGLHALARERVASLKGLLGARPAAGRLKRLLKEAFESEFGVEFVEGDLTLSENARYKAALRGIDHPDWAQYVARPAAEAPLLSAEQRVTGGKLAVTLVFDAPARRLKQVWFGGDVPVRPARTLPDLEAALKGAPIDRLEARVSAFFGSHPAGMQAAPEDFVAVVRLALRQLLLDRV